MKSLNLKNRVSLGTILVVVIATLALFYTVFAATPFIRGPELSVTVEDLGNGQVRISGTTARVSSVWLTDLPIPISDQGTFSAIRAYPPGYTEVVVRAEDRFGRSREQTKTLVTTQFIAYASEENDEESNQENSENGTSSTEGNERGEASGN